MSDDAERSHDPEPPIKVAKICVNEEEEGVCDELDAEAQAMETEHERKVEDLEKENARLNAEIEHLKTKLSSVVSIKSLKNKVLQAIVNHNESEWKEKYEDCLKKFSITVFSYSPKAYRYIMLWIYIKERVYK